MLELVLMAFVSKLGSLGKLVLRNCVSLESNWVLKASIKVILHVSKLNSVMRSLGASKAWLNL
jgi:hypothetical protein